MIQSKVEIMKEGLINVGAQMPKELERQARILAARLGMSRSEFFRLAIENFVTVKEKELEQAETSNGIRRVKGG